MENDLIEQLKKHLEGDNLSFYYQGQFDDILTHTIIGLGDHAPDLADKKGARKRMAFLVAESFQNIVRHGITSYTDQGVARDIFGVRNITPFMHIFSANEVKRSIGEFLDGKLSALKGLSNDEIKEYYRKILTEGELSTKGGAGLGLIEMARKSKQPLQYHFNDGDSELLDFGLQIDMLLDKELEDVELDKLPIATNMALFNILQKNRVIMLFSGNFRTETIMPLLTILNQNAEGSSLEKKRIKKLFHIAVELLQNVMKHGLKKDDYRQGIFTLSMDEKGYVLSTGNNIDDSNVEGLKEKLMLVQGKSTDELNALYRETLKKSARNESSNGSVGIIDMARLSNTGLEYKLTKDENGWYFSICSRFN